MPPSDEIESMTKIEWRSEDSVPTYPQPFIYKFLCKFLKSHVERIAIVRWNSQSGRFVYYRSDDRLLVAHEDGANFKIYRSE